MTILISWLPVSCVDNVLGVLFTTPWRVYHSQDYSTTGEVLSPACCSFPFCYNLFRLGLQHKYDCIIPLSYMHIFLSILYLMGFSYMVQYKLLHPGLLGEKWFSFITTCIYHLSSLCFYLCPGIFYRCMKPNRRSNIKIWNPRFITY